MKVVIINRNDKLGGAAIASHRLLHALLDCGVQARLLVIDKYTCDEHVATMGSKPGNKLRFLVERLGIFCRNGFNRKMLFKTDTATCGANAATHRWVREADVIVLGWTGQATLSLRGIGQLGKLRKPIVWIMHDMWNCTGICHHSGECEAYRGQCGNCRIVGGSGNDLSTWVQRRKRKLYDTVPIHFVAVSRWLAHCCKQSSLLRNADVRVIANPYCAKQFGCERKSGEIAGIPVDKKILVMGAARLDDPIKGFGRLIEITRRLAHHKPEVAAKVHLVLYGAINDRQLLTSLAVPYTWLGMVNHPEEVFMHADAVLSPSFKESFGYTLLEGMSCGCIPITFAGGGQVDIVAHKQYGYVAQDGDIDDFVNGIEWAMQCGITRRQLHDQASTRFDAPIVARQFIELFNEIVK